MSSSVIGLGPSEREDLATLERRRGGIILALNTTGTYQGIPVKKENPEVQMVLKAMAQAILNRRRELALAAKNQNEPTPRTRPQVGHNGKTEKKVEAIRSGQKPDDETRRKQRAIEERARRNRTMGKKSG